MNTDRPVNLALTKFRFPLAALASITHRITGVVLFVGMAVLLYLADLALTSEAGFIQAQTLLTLPLVKLVIWGVLAALIYHLVAGIKHLLLDFHIGDSKAGGQLGAVLSILIAIVLIALAGVWVW